ncbi:4595_t:CDS:2 [Ambispora leptoticha]|uniref:4595_t:CDS:1 n=1 Tax=Ambispora leptoticha TaxID=144679 RepID=A0A9N9C0D5_9GLOM|nr:4595_t:CDS:2 [Ambispora leptoticha]
MTDGYSSSTTNATSISRIRQPTRLFREFEKQKPHQIPKLLNNQNQKPHQVSKNLLASSSASSYEDDEEEENVDAFLIQSRLENNINRSSIRRTTISGNAAGLPPSYLPSRRFQYGRNTDDEEATPSITQQRRRRTTISATAATTTTTATTTIGTKKCETDDDNNFFDSNYQKNPTQRHSLPAHVPTTQSNNMEDATSTTTKSLLYLLNKEREKRCNLQKAYDSTAQAYRDLQKTHNEDISALESDIQTLQDALRKESKTSFQLNQLLRDAQSKFTEEIQKWTGKVKEMEMQGKELQTTFSETMERLEKEETEILRLRAENQKLKEQLAAGGNGSVGMTTNITRRNLEDVRKVGSLEDGDDISVSTESHKQTPSLHEVNENSDDNESVGNYSKIRELNERIAGLEDELSVAKENEQKLLANINALENENQTVVKQMEEKHEKQEKQVRLLRASLAQKQKQIDDLEKDLRREKFSQNEKRAREEKLQKELEKEKELQLQKEKQLQLLQLQQKQRLQQIQSPPQRPLSPPSAPQQQTGSESNIEDRRLQQLLLLNRNHRRTSVHSLHERKSSVTSTNSGSNESVSQEGGSVEENKDPVRIRVTGPEHCEEGFSDEEEEEQTSSVCTGSENCVQSRTSEEIVDSSIPDEFANANPSSSSNSRQNVGLNTNRGIGSGNNRGEGDAKQDNALDDDEMLDAILSDREDRVLPLIGHYSAAEFTEDEDYTMMNSFERVISERSLRQQSMVGRRFGKSSLARTLKKLNAGKRGWQSGGEDIL